MDQLKEYACYLEQEIEMHNGNAKLESIAGSICEERIAEAFVLARTKLYELFPEVGEYAPMHSP
ncbi:MAG: hypothetical protein V1725_02575 [archaeon]